MTKEGRKATHENALRLGKPSPYADEFKTAIEVDPKNELDGLDEGKPKKRGKKK